MFRLFHNKFNIEPFYSPAEVVDGKITGLPLTKDETIDFLKDDEEDKEEVIDLEDKDEKKEEKKEVKAKEDEEEEDKTEEDEDELKELEEELEEPDNEKLELIVPAPRREILKKYPELFKDFPYLEKAYYREQQYTEILPTIDDAKEAVSKAETLDKLDKDLIDGNIEKVLLAAKEAPGFNKVVDNYLETLAKVDKDAFLHVVGNTAKHIISQMVREGKRTGNESLESAAVILNQFMFATSDYTPPTKLHTETKSDPDRERLETRERELNQREFQKAHTELYTKINNSIKSTVEAHIDPKKSMTDYVRKNAVREVIETMEELIEKDSRFKIIVDKLWDNAAKKGYDKQSLDMIRSAFLSKGKTLLPSVIKKARNEALKGMGKRVINDKNESEEETPAKKDRTASRSHDKSDKLKPGMSSLEYLMADD